MKLSRLGIAFLFCMVCVNGIAQTSQIHNLKLVSVELGNEPGSAIVTWSAEQGQLNYSGENWRIRYSKDDTFTHYALTPKIDVRDRDGLILQHTLKDLADGTWFVSVALFIGEHIIDATDPLVGSVDGGWTPHGAVVINDSFQLPTPRLPGGVYTQDEVVLNWDDPGPNVETLQCQVASDFQFSDAVSYPLVPSDRGVKKIKLTNFKPGIIYFRIQGITDHQTLTGWGYGFLQWSPSRDFDYYLPWVADNENTQTKVNLNILNDAPTTQVLVGALPKKNGPFTPDIWWQEMTAYNGEIFFEDVADLFPFDLQGRGLVFRSEQVPISVSGYYDATIGSDIAVQIPFLLPEGTADEWLVPSIRADVFHRPAIVFFNADPGLATTFSWELTYELDGIKEPIMKGSVVVDPFENAVETLNIDGDWEGYIKIQCTSGRKVSVLYSIRNELGDGLVIYGFQPALQIKDGEQ